QRLMLNGIAAQLFVHEHINTTEAKAKAVRPVAEKLITFAKRGDVAARREVLKQIPDRDIVHKLFSEIGPRFAERNGGDTRVPHARRGAAAGRWGADGSDRAGGVGVGVALRLARRGRGFPSGCASRFARMPPFVLPARATTPEATPSPPAGAAVNNTPGVIVRGSVA